MSDLTHNTQHEVDGVGRLIEAFKGKPYFEGLLRLFLRRAQHIENVIWDLYEGQWLDNAEGVQLDNLGDVVGEPRKGRQDEQYRIYIRARIAINRANGRPNDTLKIARLVLEPEATVTYADEYPAAYRVEVTNSSIAVADLATLLNEVRPAGVQLTTTTIGDGALIWDSVDSLHVWDAGEWSDSI